MKKLMNLKGAKALNRNEQKIINGGGLQKDGPCGSTGGTIVHCDTTCHCGGNWSGGCCWVCY